jgi:hypothetical protein
LHEEAECKKRIAAATGSSAEALQLLSAKGIAEDESEEVRQQQSAAMVSLQRWIGILPDALNKPPAFPARGMGLRGEISSRRRLKKRRRNCSPECKRRSQGRSPNWTWEVSYGQRTGYSDLVSVGVSIRSKSHQASAKTAKPRPSWPWSTKQRLT